MDSPTVDVISFVKRYGPGDEKFIRFNWNGKHSDDFDDRNGSFRNQVLEAVLVDPSAVALELIRDLFRAETQWSVQAWSIEDGVGSLAEQLLRRGGETYLDDFLEGKFQSYDAEMGSVFPVDALLAETLLRAVRQRLMQQPASPRVDLWRRGEALFVGWLETCKG